MLNLGNITDAAIESIQRALKEANRRKIPVLLDLVGVTCSSLRREFARKLLTDGRFAVIKGNISEILAAADLPFHGTGIDAGSQDAISQANEASYCTTAKKLAEHLGCTVMATGKLDLIADRASGIPDRQRTYCIIRHYGNRLYGWSTDCGIPSRKRSTGFHRYTCCIAGSHYHGNLRRTCRIRLQRSRKLSGSSSG